MKESIYTSTDELNVAFAQRIVGLLNQGMTKNGRASLVLSGGRTPVGLFQQLSQQDIDWSKVDVTLADERWVEAGDDASNEKTIRAHLLKNKAAEATFYSLKTEHSDAKEGVAALTKQLESIQTPFDVLILGMGEDGHTASLFPCSEQIQQGLDLDSGKSYIAVQPTTAPHQRISLTLPALLNSQRVFLHLTGDSKKDVLDKALSQNDEAEMPIRAMLNRADVELIWAP
ncbi:6-phosphogluconolactonase [Alteromonadaceae bacterium M269]|nr:6-phosphogluconolactonase [Alteromonadaceae bacterium M269]